jgi:cyclopropane-fatty-acyl-phospholipid synthase
MSDAVLPSQPVAAVPSWFDRAAQSVLLQRLSSIRIGEISVEAQDATHRFGAAGGLHSAVIVQHPRFFRNAVLGGSLSIAESYLRGDWDCDDLTGLFRVFLQNSQATSQLSRGVSQLLQPVHRLYHWFHANSRTGSRRNIAAHYDLGNDLFRLMLDDTMAYSSGVFLTPEADLHAASTEKFDRVCRKLDLQPEQQLLEIGTGWGGFALHATSRYGARVTTTTISRQQYDIASQRLQQAGLADRVTLLQDDYRDLKGSFDKLVSIEMLEAVGHRYLDDYFGQCSRLLRPDGSMVIQTITIIDQEHARYLKTVDFIQKYIFPGGCLPSMGSILQSIGRATDLRLVHLEEMSPHYAQTLRLWRQRFESHLPDVLNLGYDQRFIRMWRYYLCYCEAAFEERCIGVVQLQFDKPRAAGDPLQITARTQAPTRMMTPVSPRTSV